MQNYSSYLLPYLPLGLPVLPEVYMMMAGVEGEGRTGSLATSGRLLLLPVFLPLDTTSQKEIRDTSLLHIVDIDKTSNMS